MRLCWTPWYACCSFLSSLAETHRIHVIMAVLFGSRIWETSTRVVPCLLPHPFPQSICCWPSKVAIKKRKTTLVTSYSSKTWTKKCIRGKISTLTKYPAIPWILLQGLSKELLRVASSRWAMLRSCLYSCECFMILAGKGKGRQMLSNEAIVSAWHHSKAV